jgi:16S rRNA (guanine527-N7)-methyltransferase
MTEIPPALDDAEWADFSRWCADLALPAPPGLRDALGRYRALLLAWNCRMNLTRVRDPRAVLIKHFLDSLTIVPHLAPEGPLLDVGSGAGFPGLVVKLARPELPVTLAEARARKVAFLEEVRRQLGLAQCTLLHCHLGPGEPGLQGAFGTVVSRAFRGTAAFLDLARGFLAPGGRVIVMLGGTPSAGMDPCALAREAGAARTRLISFRLPEEAGARRLLVGEWPGAERST